LQIKKIFPALLLLAITACTGAPNCSSPQVYCAALVTDTLGLDDHGINHDAWVGLQAAKANGLINQADYIESIDPRDYAKNIAYFTNKGYDLIVTSGPGLQDETLHAADLKADSVFVGFNQTYKESRPNLISITFPEDQMGFAAGVLAARLSQTRVVGAVCETSGIPAMWRYCEGFRAGAIHEDAGIKILVAYRDAGDSEKLFIDEAWGYDNGNTLIFRGADVLFAAGGLTGQGALRAATEANILAIGAERDQAAAMGESSRGVVTSFFGRAGPEVQNVIRMLRAGKPVSLINGQFGFVPLWGNYPESLGIELSSLTSDLSNGNIKTLIPIEKP